MALIVTLSCVRYLVCSVYILARFVLSLTIPKPILSDNGINLDRELF